MDSVCQDLLSLIFWTIVVELLLFIVLFRQAEEHEAVSDEVVLERIHRMPGALLKTEIILDTTTETESPSTCYISNKSVREWLFHGIEATDLDLNPRDVTAVEEDAAHDGLALQSQQPFEGLITSSQELPVLRSFVKSITSIDAISAHHSKEGVAKLQEPGKAPKTPLAPKKPRSKKTRSSLEKPIMQRSNSEYPVISHDSPASDVFKRSPKIVRDRMWGYSLSSELPLTTTNDTIFGRSPASFRTSTSQSPNSSEISLESDKEATFRTSTKIRRESSSSISSYPEIPLDSPEAVVFGRSSKILRDASSEPPAPPNTPVGMSNGTSRSGSPTSKRNSSSSSLPSLSLSSSSISSDIQDKTLSDLVSISLSRLPRRSSSSHSSYRDVPLNSAEADIFKSKPKIVRDETYTAITTDTPEYDTMSSETVSHTKKNAATCTLGVYDTTCPQPRPGLSTGRECLLADLYGAPSWMAPEKY